ncbi:MAG: phosphohistidine phosphatase SixA [Myxococcales bacterium]|nr:phosphohistidine phosphatase SixA [Myxococcales bacterium]
MQVFLIRHAEADPETTALADPQRRLTERGRLQARAIGDRLRWHDCTPTRIWASPLVRAVETAELVARFVESELAVEALPALAPDGDPRAVLAALGPLSKDAVVMVVGHGPSLARLGALLIGTPELAILRRAEAARIVDGTLRWRFAWDAEAPDPAARST